MVEPHAQPQNDHDDDDVVLTALLDAELRGRRRSASPPERRVVLPAPGQNPLAGHGAGRLVGHRCSTGCRWRR